MQFTIGSGSYRTRVRLLRNADTDQGLNTTLDSVIAFRATRIPGRQRVLYELSISWRALIIYVLLLWALAELRTHLIKAGP
jgi:hypothetical protein